MGMVSRSRKYQEKPQCLAKASSDLCCASVFLIGALKMREDSDLTIVDLVSRYILLSNQLELVEMLRGGVTENRPMNYSPSVFTPSGSSIVNFRPRSRCIQRASTNYR